MDHTIKKVSVYMTSQEHKELKALCAYLGLSMSNFVNHAIRDKAKKAIDKRRK